MKPRSYGQFCGLARALELVGERWALLLVRDLILGPKRYTDLRRSLPRIPTNVLASRLRELEQAGIVARRALPRPASSVVYELTEYGQDLRDIVLRLGAWGARSLDRPGPGDVLTPDALVLALYATFQPGEARSVTVTYELRVGDIVVHARVDDGTLDAREGPLAGADLTIEAGPVIRQLLGGEVTPARALEDGSIRIAGDPDRLAQFVRLFHVGPAPAPGPSIPR